MRRRRYLSTLATGTVVATAGCAGGKVVHAVQQTINVRPGRGWIDELPASANKIRFIARDEQPFDVYVFTNPDNVEYYMTHLDGETPQQSPPGDSSLSGRANRMANGVYQIATEQKGRQDLAGEGPTFFVVDHSGYRDETVPEEFDEELSVTLDLEAVRSTLPL